VGRSDTNGAPQADEAGGVSVDVVICAHDEEQRLGGVLAAVMPSPGVGLVLVVADACSDATAAVASWWGAAVLSIDAHDKGSAMAAGLSYVTTDDVLFLDADLEGLTPAHVAALASLPPYGGQVVGLAMGAAWLGNALPSISGQRRVPAALARSVGLAGVGWQAETKINAAVGRAGLPWRQYLLEGVINPARLDLGEWLSIMAAYLSNAPDLLRYLAHPGGPLPVARAVTA
jgi:glycosyltransferase involved in cell wall biosynthesis